jgi:hypothetical protein
MKKYKEPARRNLRKLLYIQSCCISKVTFDQKAYEGKNQKIKKSKEERKEPAKSSQNPTRQKIKK